ncbi:MAG TPA: DUF58 domain-containing protein [Anaerolineae bacterium]|nr:DUF58 domain-containing protein [Anaerolineae bacterium]MCB0176730.1 DUF58 domain-containing protein [Anaerolineae bacterium]MCB0225396.1 DUF58 domain-containing protein [Anaerolineae bacterium]MCB9103108.1 DUF58 domain-containing protein [Anaerolineales bacterium]HRV95220.1 DUF58 domain-containing protein [Anaerolineae bacterium]
MLTQELIRKIRRIEIRTRRLVNTSFAGEYHAIFKGRGIEFDEVRPYQPGDEVRTIDWNVTARTGELFVKRYIEERELTVMLLVDASASGQFGTSNRFKREIAAELAAVLAFSAISNNDKVGLLIFTDQIELFITPRKGKRHVLRLIRDLLAFEPQGRRTNLKLGLETLNHMLKRRSIIFLLSDFLTPPDSYRSILQVSNRRHDVIAITLTDPREQEFPNVGLIAIEDAETGDIQLVDTGNRKWRAEFKERVTELHTARERVFRKAKVDRIDITTDSDYVIPLTNFFEQRARRMRR